MDNDNNPKSNQTPQADPFANLPPMGTMQMGSPANPANSPQTPPVATPTSPQPTVTLPENPTRPKKKIKKVYFIIPAVIVVLLIAIGIGICTFLFSSRKVICTSTNQGSGISLYVEYAYNYENFQTITGTNYLFRYNLPYKVSSSDINILKEVVNQQLGEDLYAKTNFYKQDDYSMVAEGSITREDAIEIITKIGVEGSRDHDAYPWELKQEFQAKGFTCKEE